MTENSYKRLPKLYTDFDKALCKGTNVQSEELMSQDNGRTLNYQFPKKSNSVPISPQQNYPITASQPCHTTRYTNFGLH